MNSPDRPTISPEYRELNRRLHATNQAYGTSGHDFAPLVAEVARLLATREILDYGCGKRTLERKLGYAIANYDPAIAGLEAAAAPADVVVCTEVLEHVEPELIDNVLDDLARLTRRAVVLSVACGPAEKSLPDGRNTHLIQEKPDWWLPKIEKHFRLCRLFPTARGFAFVGQSLHDTGEIPDLAHIGPPPEVKRIQTKSVYNDAQRCANIRSTMLRCLPAVPVIPPHGKKMVLACYGPGLAATLGDLKAELAGGGDLYTVSGAHQFLIDRGIVPIGHVESDPRPINVHRCGKPDRRVCYFLASACDRALFDLLHGFEAWVYHVTSSNAETELIAKFDRSAFTVDGGTNVGMSAIALGTVLGYRDFVIHGMDCSFAVDDTLLWWPRDKPAPASVREGVKFHAGAHPNEDQDVFRVWVGDRPFITSPQMMQGAQDYLALVNTRRDCRFRLHGDGFLPALVAHAKKARHEQRTATNLHRLRPAPASGGNGAAKLDYQTQFLSRLRHTAGAQHAAH